MSIDVFYGLKRPVFFPTLLSRLSPCVCVFWVWRSFLDSWLITFTWPTSHTCHSITVSASFSPTYHQIAVQSFSVVLRSDLSRCSCLLFLVSFQTWLCLCAPGLLLTSHLLQWPACPFFCPLTPATLPSNLLTSTHSVLLCITLLFLHITFLPPLAIKNQPPPKLCCCAWITFSVPNRCISSTAASHSISN